MSLVVLTGAIWPRSRLHWGGGLPVQLSGFSQNLSSHRFPRFCCTNGWQFRCAASWSGVALHPRSPGVSKLVL